MTAPGTLTSLDEPARQGRRPPPRPARARGDRPDDRRRAARAVRALDAGVEIDEAFVCDDLVRTRTRPRDVVIRLAATVGMTQVSEAVIGKLAFGDRSDGVVAIVRTPRDGPRATLRCGGDPLVVVVEGVEKPGNLGAILRTADGAGADAVIAADPRTDLFNPNAIRASLGTIFTMPVAAASSADVLDVARRTRDPDRGRAGRRGSVLHGRRPPRPGRDRPRQRGRRARLGLGRPAGRAGPHPDARIADSLNVSVAAAVLLYEAVRQRSGDGGR